MTRFARFRRLHAGLAGLLLAAGFLAACGGPPPPRRAIVILLDAARADRFSCYGYERETTPNMDRIAERGHVFEKHFSTGVNTRGSMPTFLYSRYYIKPVFPYSSRVSLYSPDDLFRVLDDEAVSFPKALEAGGMHTAAISAHHWFHEETDFAKEFGEFHDYASKMPKRGGGYAYPAADGIIDETLRWLRGVGDEDEFLLYVHLMDTHFPHEFGPDAQEFFGASEYSATRFKPTGEAIGPKPLEGRDREYMDALYDGSLRFADREIGRVIDLLEERGWLDETLFAITADHGERLWHHPGRYLHGGDWMDDVSHVPMIVSLPGSVPIGRTTRPTQGADVHPTLLALLDTQLPEGKSCVGLNMFSPELEQREWLYTRLGARSEQYKVLLDVDESELEDFFHDDDFAQEAAVRVFELDADPLEFNDLSKRQPDLAARLRDEFRSAQKDRFERYHGSVADVQPRGSFAIESRDWETAPNLPEAQELGLRGLTDAPRLIAESSTGWLRSNAWGETWLRARPGAEPLEILVRIPSGEYRVDLEGNGSFDIEIDGQPQEVDLLEVGADWKAPWKTANLGLVRVEDQLFRLRVTSRAGASRYRVRRIGFRPTNAREELDDEERTEALRALGYAE